MYQYIFKENSMSNRLLVLLHGTGGSEEDLLPVANLLDSQANVLSIRGNVSEGGALRYFKRKGEGIYDVEDLMSRGRELSGFIMDFVKKHGFDSKKVILVGFSNGANMAINLIVNQTNLLSKGILFAPMYPEPLQVTQNLTDVAVFISMGKQDPIVSLENCFRVRDLFLGGAAQVTEYWVESHEITLPSIQAASDWIKRTS